MRRMSGAAPDTARQAAAILGLVVLLAGCAQTERATTWGDGASARAEERFSSLGGWLRLPWGVERPTMPQDSLTVARVMGAPPTLEPLRPEAGNVWPAQEGPRATLANPDAALRGIPNYRTGDPDRQSSRGLPPGLSGSSSPPPPANPAFESRNNPTLPPLLADQPTPWQPASAQTAVPRSVQTPQGAAPVTGGTARSQTYAAPGGGIGRALTDGNVTTLIGPDGQVTTTPTPR